MTIFETLTPTERARQLGNPEGVVGRAAADRLKRTTSRDANAVALLRAEAGSHVLEIGFGNSRTVANVIAQPADVRYTGIDISSRLWRKRFASMPR
jgi:tRNA G46 methylase TrmB